MKTSLQGQRAREELSGNGGCHTRGSSGREERMTKKHEKPLMGDGCLPNPDWSNGTRICQDSSHGMLKLQYTVHHLPLKKLLKCSYWAKKIVFSTVI